VGLLAASSRLYRISRCETPAFGGFIRLLATLCRKFCISPPKLSHLFVFTAFGTSAFIYLFFMFIYIFMYFIYVFIHFLATSKLRELCLHITFVHCTSLCVFTQTCQLILITYLQTTAVLTDGAKERNIVRRGIRRSLPFTTKMLKLSNYS